MKKVIVLSVLLLLTLILSAQTPQSFRYQAVARDNSGAVLANQNVSFQISILSGSVSGTEVYKETHTGKTTNAFGLVDLEIGKGTPVTGTFSAINWESNLYFVKVDMDPAGGSTYQVLSTSQLLSVPYALYSEKAGNGFSGDYNDLFNKPLLFDGAWNSLTGKPSTLSGYGITDGINTSHPANGITSGMITNWNTAYNWGNHAGLYKPLSYQPLWTEITSVPAGFADGTDNVNDADNNITNEIQVLSLTGNALSLSKEGGTVTIPGDNWGTQAVVTDATLAGNGTATAPLQIARQTAIAGQVLKWNGSAWNPADDDTSSVLKIALPYAGRAAGENFLFSIINEGQGNGIRGETISGTGLLGLASATAAMNIGTAGQSASSSGVGIWGNNIALTGNGIAVKGSVQSSTGYSGFFERGKFYIEGNTGIGTLNPATKLEVAGQVKITGGNPGAGKILTSDASGLATWQTPESSLTLPYSGTVSTTGDQAFSIWNTGTGNGIHAMANSGNGLVGYSYGGTNTSGIMGIASGSGDNQGVSGSSNSSLGTGVSGSASSLTGTTIGVSGLVFSPDGYSGFFEGGKFYISGNAGIGVTAPSAKLDVNGQIKIRGGSPGTGKVLTSDASGLAVWADPEGLRLPFSDTVSTPRPLISICNSGSGNGILAISKQITGTTCGIAGEAWSSSGAGIIGSSYSTTGTNYGVKGKTYSADGFSGYFDGGKFYISGMTGLGTATPSQRLHIKGNVPGNAVVLIEPNKWEAAGDYGELRFGDANHYIRGEHTKGMTAILMLELDARESSLLTTIYILLAATIQQMKFSDFIPSTATIGAMPPG